MALMISYPGRGFSTSSCRITYLRSPWSKTRALRGPPRGRHGPAPQNWEPSKPQFPFHIPRRIQPLPQSNPGMTNSSRRYSLIYRTIYRLPLRYIDVISGQGGRGPLRRVSEGGHFKIRHSREGGHVRIRHSREGGHVRIRHSRESVRFRIRHSRESGNPCYRSFDETTAGG